MSTGRPFAMYGMSSTGTIIDTTPLLPWRPAILSPGWMRRLTARYTFTIFSTPGARSSPAVILACLSLKRLSNSSLCALICSCARSSELGGVLVLHAHREPLVLLQAVEVLVGDLGALLQAPGPPFATLPTICDAQAGVDRAFEDAELIVEVLLDALDLHLLDLARALVLLDAVAGEHGARR